MNKEREGQEGSELKAKGLKNKVLQL